MTTSDLIRLLEKYEYGGSGRARALTISVKDKDGNYQSVLSENQTLIIESSGDGVAGAELGLKIVKQ
jgi:hypothetical protein